MDMQSPYDNQDMFDFQANTSTPRREVYTFDVSA